MIVFTSRKNAAEYAPSTARWSNDCASTPTGRMAMVSPSADSTTTGFLRTASVDSEEKALKVAKEIGYPVIVKATAGGGGRGMRVVRTPAELPNAVKTAQREAEAAFGVADVYLEKYVESPRHIEFQVLGDQFGNVVHLGERECSIQRRHQKLIEETPSPVISDKVRKKMGALVVDAAKAVQYTNAGTFEFLMDKDGKFYFMEANTRLQVEHPVTEFITGVDLVKEQIRIAAGERLGFKQGDVEFRGHSIEIGRAHV